MKRYLSVILALVMLVVFLVSPASAGGLIGNLETDPQIYGLSELGVRTLVSRYFAQRKAYLQGTSNTINSAVTSMVVDEATHKETLEQIDAVLVDSTVVIGTVILEDYMARVEATETATIMVDGESVQESIVHTIGVYAKHDGSIIVCSDGYVVVATGFASASYVNAAAVELASLNLEGSPDCITHVAYQELGTTYSVGGVTKYGSWFGDMKGASWYDTAAWCAMFVSWCAHHASVPEAVIPRESYCPTMAEFFADWDSYYRSASGGGSYVPEPGDIIFLGYNENDTFLSPGHVGIVTFVANGIVFFVDGNVSTYVDGVRMKTVNLSQESLTSTAILGYGNPGYGNLSHRILQWTYDDEMHRGFCTICDGEVFEDHYLVPSGNGYVCYICGYSSNT